MSKKTEFKRDEYYLIDGVEFRFIRCFFRRLANGENEFIFSFARPKEINECLQLNALELSKRKIKRSK